MTLIFSEDRSPGCGHFIPEGADECDYCRKLQRAEANERKRQRDMTRVRGARG